MECNRETNKPIASINHLESSCENDFVVKFLLAAPAKKGLEIV